MNTELRIQQDVRDTVGMEDCGCGCGGAGCCGAKQELVFVGSLDRYNYKTASEVRRCDGSCGCGGYSPTTRQDDER